MPRPDPPARNLTHPRRSPLERRTHIERSQQARGLLLLALAVLVFSLLRFGLHRAFPPGWYRLW